MTDQTPKPGLSKSIDQPVAVIFLCFGLAALCLTLALAITPLPIPQYSEVPAYDNAASRQLLVGNLPARLAVIDPKKSTLLQNPQLGSWQIMDGTNRHTEFGASILQYFYEQTGTAHPWAGYPSRSRVKGLAFVEERLGTWILEKISHLEGLPQNAVLEIENNRAVKFQEHRNGYVVLPNLSARALKNAWLAGLTKLVLPLETRSPEIRLSDLNNIGIKEQVALGQSDFTGSSAARINNIRAGAARYNGIILAPGEEFSFNKYLGPVDAEHGFLPELVIKPEGATPEFGGGLCQVSTTAFRAAFFGGLPITQRRNHSYAVKYYEWIADDQPRAVGLDATIYSPYQDMKFVNDTPGSLLIWTRVEGKRLYFDFFGMPDEREVTVDGPHPFDKRPSGAVKSTVSRTVLRNGKTEAVTFNSTYIPPKIAEQSYQLPAPATIPPTN